MQSVDDEMLAALVECMVSLVVRSPRFRETGVALAEHFRGPLGERERNGLISLNIMHCQRRIADSIGTRGKFAVLLAREHEFHFGDGFYHNLGRETQTSSGARIVVPITPNVTVCYCHPISYSTNPRLMTLSLTSDEVKFFNRTIQIYARDMVFFRGVKPDLLDVYRSAEHRIYDVPDPMDDWFQDIS